MKDMVEIKKVDEIHFEITRTLVDRVDRLNLDNQLQQLDQTEEGLLDQLEMIRNNRQTILEALGLTVNNSSAIGTGKVVNLKKGN